MSYELKINEKDRTAARFINSVRKKLFMAVFDAAGHKRTSQQAIATKLGINRSVVNRMLRGGNLTLRSVAELAWALGKTPQFSLEDEESSGFRKELGPRGRFNPPQSSQRSKIY